MQTDVLVEKAPTGGGSFVSLVGRNIGASTRYTAQLRYSATGSVTLSLTSVVNATETVLGSYRMPANYTPGSVLKVRFEAVGTGTTTLRAKVWASGTLEPAWQATATDSTAALQNPGGLRLDLYHSGTATGTQTLRVDNLQAARFGHRRRRRRTPLRRPRSPRR